MCSPGQTYYMESQQSDLSHPASSMICRRPSIVRSARRQWKENVAAFGRHLRAALIISDKKAMIYVKRVAPMRIESSHYCASNRAILRYLSLLDPFHRKGTTEIFGRS